MFIFLLVDANGDGVLDEQELEALFAKEVTHALTRVCVCVCVRVL